MVVIQTVKQSSGNYVRHCFGWVVTPSQGAASQPPNGGNCIIRTPTRRRHTASHLLMLQNPHRHWCGGRRRDRGARLRCPWAVAGPGWASRRRAEPKARCADGERAGRRPRAHQAARPDSAQQAAIRNWAASRSTARSAAHAAPQSPVHLRYRRRNAPRALPGKTQ